LKFNAERFTVKMMGMKYSCNNTIPLHKFTNQDEKLFVAFEALWALYIE
jgi:hypothetical protein